MAPLSKPIRNGQLPDWKDLNNTRDTFRDLGLYNEDEDGPMLDVPLIKTIKDFQKAGGLIVDGIMNPNGETENALFNAKKGQPHPKTPRN